MFNIISHQGNTTQKHNEIPLHFYENGWTQSLNNKWRVSRNQNFHTVLARIQNSATTLENSLAAPQMVKQLPYSTAIQA